MSNSTEGLNTDKAAGPLPTSLPPLQPSRPVHCSQFPLVSPFCYSPLYSEKTFILLLLNLPILDVTYCLHITAFPANIVLS